MNKVIRLALTATMGLSIAASSVIAQTEVPSTKVEQNTKAMKKEFESYKEKFKFLNEIKFVKGQSQDKFTQMLLEAPNGQRFEMIFIPGSDYLIAGKVFNKSGQPVNLPANMKVVDEGVAFSIGHGPKKFYLVTDPECPYCKELEKEIAKTDGIEDELTIMVVPMPLSFHKKARPMMYYILAGKTPEEKAKRMRDIMTDKDDKWKSYEPTDEEKEEYEKILKKGEAAAKELGARGTPSTYDESGNQVNPYVIIGIVEASKKSKS